MSQSCHCEAPQGPWQSRRTVLNFRKISANSKHFTGDSHVASLLGMTKRRLFAIPRIPRRFPLVFPPKPSAGLVFRHPDAKTKCTARQAGRSACQKVPSGLLPSCLQNCKTFCSTVLQFCRCGGLFDAKGHPDGFLSACRKVPSGFLPSCFQNCKMKFCSIILQFCRCGGLLNAKGNPDGFLSHFSSLRNLRLGSFFASPFRKNEMYRPASRTVHFVEKKERERKKRKSMKKRGGAIYGRHRIRAGDCPARTAPAHWSMLLALRSAPHRPCCQTRWAGGTSCRSARW